MTVLQKFLPTSRRAIIATSVGAGLVLAGGGIATGAALTSSAHSPAAAATPSAGAAKQSKGSSSKATADVVTVVTGSSVTVDTTGGPKTFALTKTTTFREGKSQVPSSALQTGEKARIRMVPGTAANPVAQTVTIVPTSAPKASPTA